MRLILIALVLLLALACEGPDGERPQPFAARAVCEVERWLSRDDYRRREPGSNLCDSKGIRVPRLPSPEEPAPAEAEPDSKPSSDTPG